MNLLSTGSKIQRVAGYTITTDGSLALVRLARAMNTVFIQVEAAPRIVAALE